MSNERATRHSNLAQRLNVLAMPSSRVACKLSRGPTHLSRPSSQMRHSSFDNSVKRKIHVLYSITPHLSMRFATFSVTTSTPQRVK